MNFLLFLVPVVLVFGHYLHSTSGKSQSTAPKDCLDCDA